MATDLALVLHFHQPVGNFGDVFERITDRCYRPVLETLHRYPRVKTHLHINGILLEWMDRHAADMIEMVADLASRGSTELITGGYFEPILASIPTVDAVGQVRTLSHDLKRRFGQTPTGLWLTERVWEPRLPTPLHEADVRYTMLDDTIFRWAGVEVEDMAGHWMTEDGGRPLAVFPMSKRLRYTIPFRPVEETFEFLAGMKRADGKVPLAVYADDVEKFGEWPGTYEWVFEKKWLEQFLRRLADSEGVRTVHLGPQAAENAPLGRTYLPTGSYPEMTEWALPTPARIRLEKLLHDLEDEDPQGAAEFVRGGGWRGFFAKYPESDRIHKKMLRISARLHALESEDPRKQAAQLDLYRGQCNDAYWHGAFGGVYLGHLRRALEHHLVRAERTLDELEEGTGSFRRVSRVDLDADGRDEVELRTPGAQIVVDPDRGGLLMEWDLRPSCENLVTVMRRHDEAFHHALRDAGEDALVRVDDDGEAGDDGIETIHGGIRVKEGVELDDLRVDDHDRLAAMDWLAPAGADVSDVAFTRGARLLGGRRTLESSGSDGPLVLVGEEAGWQLRKSWDLEEDGAVLVLRYGLSPVGIPEPARFVSEWNLLVGYTGEDLEEERDGVYEPMPRGDRHDVSTWRMRAGGDRKLELTADPGARLTWDVVHTVSSSEAGLEKVAQGTSFLLSWPIAGQTSLTVRWRVTAPAVGADSHGV